jgi:hypothetical protein
MLSASRRRPQPKIQHASQICDAALIGAQLRFPGRHTVRPEIGAPFRAF